VDLLLLNEAAPRVLHAGLVPAVDRPLRRLVPVVILQRLAAQSKARIPRQISLRLLVRHLVTASTLQGRKPSPDRAPSKPVRHNGAMRPRLSRRSGPRAPAQ